MKVSVCIAAFNKPLLLVNTLDSIVSQKPPFDYEVIVVDDGSKAGVVSRVCIKYPSVRCIRIDRPPTFRNPCTARNVAYREAKGEIIICQSDEVIHVTPNSLELFVQELEASKLLSDAPGHFIIAQVLNREPNGQAHSEFTGPTRKLPYFFLGAVYRKDLYQVGGNDEDFAVGTGYEDAWFSDCLMNGLGLQPIYTTQIVGHHQWHKNYNTPKTDSMAKALYEIKLKRATAREIPWQSTSGPWIEGNVEEVFTEIYHKNHWGGSESISGVGSSQEATAKIREGIKALIEKYNIKSILDIGCGDCNWFPLVGFQGRYTGVDTVAELIDKNREKYPHLRFLHLNAVADRLPKADLIIARDCLVHLSRADQNRLLENIYRSGSQYFLTTTFPNHKNRIISTGSWAPLNLQESPYCFKEPLELVNEGCTESYPTYTDKSLGLWPIANLPVANRLSVKSLVVCVNYSDKLAITLPRNKRHFDRTLVVTSPDDTQTQELARAEGVDLYITDAFTRYGAYFNKGMAIEESLDELGRDGWICIWDADIVMPNTLNLQNPDPRSLHVPIRRTLADWKAFRPDGIDWSSLPSPTQPHEFDGYFQLFHGLAMGERPWYGIEWTHAGGCDSDFQFKFDKHYRKRLPFEVLHLGSEGYLRIGNWAGVTPEGKEQMRSIREARRRVGGGVVPQEKICPRLPALPKPTPEPTTDRIPRVMRFFWQGRLSFLRYLTLYSFRRLNPDWVIEVHYPTNSIGPRTWTSGEVDDREYQGPDYWDHLPNLGIYPIEYASGSNLAPAQQSDLFQWEILGRLPGFYADMDILWTRPLEPLRLTLQEQDAVFCNENGFIAIGLFASSGCSLFTDIGKQRPVHTVYQQYGSELVYALANTLALRCKPKGAQRTVQVLQSKYPQYKILDLPTPTVYPYDWRFIHSIFEEHKPIPNESYGIHWFGGSDVAKPWNFKLTEDNWYKHLSTITRAIGKLV